MWYLPPGTPGGPAPNAHEAPGVPPMAAYPAQHGHPPQAGYPVPAETPRGEEMDAQSKTVTVNETERT